MYFINLFAFNHYNFIARRHGTIRDGTLRWRSQNYSSQNPREILSLALYFEKHRSKVVNVTSDFLNISVGFFIKLS